MKSRYEILDSLPAYGPMYIPVSNSGDKFYSEGYVVRFFKDDGTEWVANFNDGWTDINEVFEYPKLNIIVIFARGIGYVMNPNNEKPIFVFNSIAKYVFQDSNGILILIDDISIELFNPHSLELWLSKRISWDGFKDVVFDGTIVKGESFDPTNSVDEWVSFSFNIETKEILGGSYRESEIVTIDFTKVNSYYSNIKNKVKSFFCEKK